MSSLTLIVGTIHEAKDPKGILQYDPPIYEFWEEDLEDPENYLIRYDEPSIEFFGRNKFNFSQPVGAGKTLYAMHEISKKAINPNTKLLSNCGLVWDSLNDSKEKKDWQASINSLEDLEEAKHCTVLIDDIYSTILQWNTEVARVVSTCANAAGKEGLDIIITAQREVMIPPAIRDIATSWIVPIITIRDNTRINARGERGYPIEMRAMYFNSEKILRSYSEPIRGLDALFNAYSTVERAKGLKKEEDGARTNQPGFKLEAEAVEFLRDKVPAIEWQHLNGKHVFDVISETHALDIVGTDSDGYLILDHKDLTKHIRTAKRKCQKPYLMFKAGGEWRFVGINHNLSNFVDGKKINPDMIYKARLRTINSFMGDQKN